MSCFVVEPTTMQRVVIAAQLFADQQRITELCGVQLANRDGFPIEGADQKLWDVLFTMNEAAFAACYQGRHAESGKRDLELCPASSKHQRGRIKPVELIALYKSIEVLVYQCSESPVDETPAFKMLSAFLDEFAHYTLRKTPAYEAALWG